MVALGRSQSQDPRVEFSEGLEARVVDRRIPPPGRRLRASNRQPSLIERDVLPLQCLISHALNPQKKSSVAATYAQNARSGRCWRT
jgi:hypothetical protein